MEPTIKQLKYLLAIKKEGSFSRAAESCYITQSTLSAGIKELETILGQTLVNRTGRQITLTAFGEDIAQSAREILDKVTLITEKSKKAEAPLSGPLRLGIIPTIAPYLLPDLLTICQEHFPELTLQIHEDLSERLVTQLQKSHLDILLMAFPFNTPGMAQFPLYEEEFMIACPRDQKIKDKISINDLDDTSLLLLEDGHCLRDHALSACKIDTGTQNKKPFNATSLPTLIQMVGHGYGMTLLPRMAAQSSNLPSNIRTVEFKTPKPTRQIGLAWNKGHRKSEEYTLLAQTLATHLPHHQACDKT